MSFAFCLLVTVIRAYLCLYIILITFKALRDISIHLLEYILGVLFILKSYISAFALIEVLILLISDVVPYFQNSYICLISFLNDFIAVDTLDYFYYNNFMTFLCFCSNF